MPISIEQSDSHRKSIDLTVTPSATGVTVSGSVRWFDDEFTIASTIIPCTYVEDQSYRVVLARHALGAALVLADDDGLPSGYEEICSPVRWRFTSPTDTCATVDIRVTRRVLVPMLDDEGSPVALPDPTVHVVSTAPVLPAADPAKVAGRRKRQRIRDLRQQLVTLRESGTHYGAMSAANRLLVHEYVALTGEAAPMAVP